MNGHEIDFNHEIRAGNYQSVLGPDLKPSPIYYGMLFAVFIRHGTPEIILPSTKALISSKIKAFGFSDGESEKFLLINKDTNQSLNGTVFVKSHIKSPMKCIYMEAPSLDSKDNITIGGYNFIGGNAEAQGSFIQKKLAYDEIYGGYDIPIKYAQAVVCEVQDAKFVWPKGFEKYGNKLWWNLSLFAIFLFFTWSF